MENIKGKVLQGTCGWSDSSIVKCGRFYPTSVKTCSDKLEHYSSYFPCVECDSSNYAIPSPLKIKTWLKCVPTGFLFHFKSYGLFTRKFAPWNSLPRLARERLSALVGSLPASKNISYDNIPSSVQDYLWELFNAALEPAHKENKLGVVVFQFPLTFHPSDESRRYVEHCRQKLSSAYKMVVEFRSRAWLCHLNLSDTVLWMKDNNIGLVVADDLKDELYIGASVPTHDLSKTNEKPSNPAAVPIVMALGAPHCCYVRIHRREGKKRLLSDAEISSWSQKLVHSSIQNEIQGPIYFMWGTDYEDQPIINSRNLTKAIGHLALKWEPKPINSLFRFCSPKGERGTKRTSDGQLKQEPRMSEVQFTESLNGEKDSSVISQDIRLNSKLCNVAATTTTSTFIKDLPSAATSNARHSLSNPSIDATVSALPVVDVGPGHNFQSSRDARSIKSFMSSPGKNSWASMTLEPKETSKEHDPIPSSAKSKHSPLKQATRKKKTSIKEKIDHSQKDITCFFRRV